jgi:hypothetical protein
LLGLWISFLTVGAYLGISIASTHPPLEKVVPLRAAG